MRTTFVIIFLFTLLLAKSAFSQTVKPNYELQNSLNKLSAAIWKQKTDSGRLNANSVFFGKFHSALEKEFSDSGSFDSITGITRVRSNDGKICIFTWNVPLSTGANKYFGFIQLLSDSSRVIQLQSVENETTDFTSRLLSAQSWYGAIYYKLIEEKVGNKTIYTVLGWDGYTSVSNRKMIDIISIDDHRNIVFGMPVFKTATGIKTRVVLEFAEKSGMLLRYDYQAIRVEKRKKIRKEYVWLIVMDRLVPMNPSMQGMEKFYVPAGDIYDGFIFRDGYWVLVTDIEVANKPNNQK